MAEPREHYEHITAESVIRHAAEIAAILSGTFEVPLTFDDTGRIDLTRTVNAITADLVAGGVRMADLGAQQAGYVDVGNVAGGSISSTSYADFAAHGYTPRRSTSRILVVAKGYHGYVSGTTTLAIRRGTTVIGDEDAYIVSAGFTLFAIDTGHGGSASTWNLSAKNSTPAGAIALGKVAIIDFA